MQLVLPYGLEQLSLGVLDESTFFLSLLGASLHDTKICFHTQSNFFFIFAIICFPKMIPPLNAHLTTSKPAHVELFRCVLHVISSALRAQASYLIQIC